MKKYWYGDRFDERVIFEDKKGKKWDPDEVENLATWELEDLGLHVAEV